MRILIIANIPPFVNGGAETQARFLAEEFVNLGHSVTVAGHEIPSSLNQNDYSFNVVHIPTLRTTRLSRGISYFLSLSWLVIKNRKKFDVIYCRFLGEAALSICLLKQIFDFNITLVACTAGTGRAGDVEYLKNLPFTNFLKFLINNQCNAINNISPKIGEELISIGVNSALLKYIPNGIKINNPTLKTNISSPRKLVYLGRLAPAKGLPYLLEATRLMFASGDIFELHLIGGGSDREDLEKQVHSHKLQKYVFFHGHIDNQLITECLSSYDIFILPSLSEGFATAVIEAMFAGLPVAVTLSGGPDYFVDNSVGRLCSPGDSHALSNIILELLHMDDSELLEMGARGQKRVVECFDIKIIAKDYINLFTELLNQKSRC